MHNISASLTIAALFASAALAQSTDRLLHFTATASAQDFQEIATVIQATTDITQAKVDATEKSLSLHGTAGQIALAEWLFTNLDKPISIRLDQKGAKHEYRVSDSADDVVRLFYLTNPEVPRGVQESRPRSARSQTSARCSPTTISVPWSSAERRTRSTQRNFFLRRWINPPGSSKARPPPSSA
jgi:hypothetical protein